MLNARAPFKYLDVLIICSPSVDKPYPVHGGFFREEAIMLLRKFYVQENDNAPQPKQKRTRELKTVILPTDIHTPKSGLEECIT